MEDCPVCAKPVLDHAFLDAVRCGHALGQQARVLLRQAVTAAEDTVDASTWTRAADVRSAMESQDQALAFAQEALPELKGDED